MSVCSDSEEGLVNTVELAIDWGLPISYDMLCEYIKIVSERQQDEE